MCMIGPQEKRNKKDIRALNMAADIAEEEKCADSEYREFLKEKDRYLDFDEFCRQEKI